MRIIARIVDLDFSGLAVAPVACRFLAIGILGGPVTSSIGYRPR